MTPSILTCQDRLQLEARGISTDEAERQLELLAGSTHYVDLVRPSTPGDGIERIRDDEVPELHALHDEASRRGRFVKFVPASGVATRMFAELLQFQQCPGRERSWTEVLAAASRGERESSALATFVREVQRFPFYEELKAELARRGEDLDGLARAGAFQPILDALLGPAGLGHQDVPKGLLPFHAYPEGPRAPLEEHLVEAAHLIQDGRGICRVHFTVSPEHIVRFEERLRRVGSARAAAPGAEFLVTFSVQKPSTDTLALDASGRLLRDAEGRAVLRPAGHGALIENLDALRADLVLIKNIDNVQPERLLGLTVRWKKILGGLLVRLERQVHEHVLALRECEPREAAMEQALAFARDSLHITMGALDGPTSCQAKRAFLISRLNRPLRVLGMVQNRGEPGGGPFWVRGRNGSTSLQVVEKAQVDPDNPDQQRILGTATHFNPVDLACSLRDASGRSFELGRFVDPEAAIVTTKLASGRELKVLERPGLWNGAMANWNTVFVEVPIETFTPVKSVLDLLREEHR